MTEKTFRIPQDLQKRATDAGSMNDPLWISIFGSESGKVTITNIQKAHLRFKDWTDHPDIWGGEDMMGWTTRILRKENILDNASQKGHNGEVMDATVCKIDDELGLVMGFAIICKQNGEDYFDRQGDHIPESAMIKAATNFMRSDRVMGEMHRKAAEPRGTVVFSFPLTMDIAKSLGIETQTTGLLVGMMPDDETILEKFRTGEYTGFSIGGRRLVDEEVNDDDA